MCRRAISALNCCLFLSALLIAAPALAQNPSLGSVDCDDVRANAQQTVNDPELDVTGPGGNCPNPVNYGFDYASTAVWYDQTSGNLYFCVNTAGNIGDSDQDGGYHTEATVCGGHPDCVNQEQDVFGNVFAAETEKITWSFDRDCDGINDLVFTLTGSTIMRADSLNVTIDVLPGHTSHATEILGGRGVAWQGVTVQRNTDVVCVPDRNGAVLVIIPDWLRYFTDDGTTSGNVIGGVSPTTFRWLVNGGNNADFYNEDEVRGFFDIAAPGIDIEKTATPTALCAVGATSTFTVTAQNTGNVVLTDVIVTDQLPAGLNYVGGSGVPAPTSVVAGLITWPTTTLDPGESKIYTFVAEKTAECSGTVTNTANVSGTFFPACYEAEGIEATTLQDSDTFDITCNSADVSIDVDANITACVGQTAQLPVTVTNTGSQTEDISVAVTIDGAPGNPEVFNDVPAGGVRNFNVPVTCSIVGTVPVSATATASVDGEPNCQDTANDAGTVTCQTCEVETCWMTGGGCLNIPDEHKGMKMHTFGGNVGPPAGSSWEHIVRQKKQILFNFHSWDAEVDSCWHDGGDGPCHPAAEPNNIVWSGTGKYSINNGAREFDGTFTAHVIDAGEPGSHDGPCGSNDWYEITVWDENHDVVFHVEGYTTCGNLQIHKPVGPGTEPSPTVGGKVGVQDFNTGLEGTEPLQIGRPVPNPFQGATTIRYAIAGDQAASVKIAVYDVAGRMVRTLEDNLMSPGSHEVVWDGRDDSGLSAPGGMYFIRVTAGQEESTTRVILAR